MRAAKLDHRRTRPPIREVMPARCTAEAGVENGGTALADSAWASEP
jgi:hypothetical protein